MRISENQRWNGTTDRLREAQARVVQAQTQATDGKRMHKPSDDPYSLGRALDVRSYAAAVTTYKANLDRGTQILKTSEATLDETGQIAQRAYALAVSAANSATSQSARTAMATEVGDLRSRLLSLGNTKMADGTAIFAGQKTDVTPFTVSATGGIVYNGDNATLKVESGPGQTTDASVDASALYRTLYDRLTKLKDSLEGGDVAALGDVRIGEMKDASRQVDGLRGDVGTGMQTIASLASAHGRRIDDLAEQGSDIEDVDFADALVKYKQAETAYEAALQVTSQGAKLSLMDYLR